MSFNGAIRIGPYGLGQSVPSMPRPSQPATRCTCLGCGAPLPPKANSCAYCLLVYGNSVVHREQLVDVTTMEDTSIQHRQALMLGLLSINEMRATLPRLQGPRLADLKPYAR